MSGICFRNRLRWTLETDRISLEHLRYGYPVFLFHFEQTQSNRLESVAPHLCSKDTYSSHIIWDEKSIDYHVRIIGENKNDELLYSYS